MLRADALPWPGSRLLEILHPVAAPDASRLEPARALLRATAAVPAYARCLPPVASRLRATGALDPADRSYAEMTAAWAAGRVASLAEDLARLGEVCRARGTRAFLCKGTALHGLLYEDASARPCADVDLFVPATDVASLHEGLLAHGFAPAVDASDRIASFSRTRGRHPWLLDLGYRGPGGGNVVEVKADPVGVGMPIRRLAELDRGGTASPRYAGLLLPSAETMVLQMAFSASRRDGFDLLAHAELAGVLHARRAELDAERLLTLLRGEGLYGILRGVLEVTGALFPGTVPRELLRRRGRPAGYVPASVRGPRVFGGERRGQALAFWSAQALGGRRPWAFARWFLRRAVPPEPLLARLVADGAAAPAPLRRLRRLLSRAGR